MPTLCTRTPSPSPLRRDTEPVSRNAKQSPGVGLETSMTTSAGLLLYASARKTDLGSPADDPSSITDLCSQPPCVDAPSEVALWSTCMSKASPRDIAVHGVSSAERRRCRSNGGPTLPAATCAAASARLTSIAASSASILEAVEDAAATPACVAMREYSSRLLSAPNSYGLPTRTSSTSCLEDGHDNARLTQCRRRLSPEKRSGS
mmetsp:Transcript_5482/g.15725  ORF Transcript_5482/g.15725 Transcript_5482/m.15725 type:complete len:205 (+) Transcript_5482:366-980(+)